MLDIINDLQVMKGYSFSQHPCLSTAGYQPRIKDATRTSSNCLLSVSHKKPGQDISLICLREHELGSGEERGGYLRFTRYFSAGHVYYLLSLLCCVIFFFKNEIEDYLVNNLKRLIHFR